MSDLEKFINDEPSRTPTLLKAALAHVQFETIHPFLDGNGRLGRLLIALLFAREQVLSEPLLYLSLFFKTNRARYYELLQHVRTEGDWESWFEFFLKGVIEVATSASETAHRILALFESDRSRLELQGRQAGTLIRVHDLFKREVFTTSTEIMTKLGMTRPTALAALERLTELGIVHEGQARQRGNAYAYSKYLDILNEGAEPL
jgi:Fic family protein